MSDFSAPPLRFLFGIRTGEESRVHIAVVTSPLDARLLSTRCTAPDPEPVSSISSLAKKLRDGWPNSSLYANLVEESHETEWRYLSLLEALDNMQNARERLDREIATGMKIRGQLSLKHRMQSEAMASSAMRSGGYDSIDDLPHESDDEETRRQKRERARRTTARRRQRPGRGGQ